MNLKVCSDALLKIAKENDLEFHIAIVEGDNILDKQEDLRSLKVREIDSGDLLPENLLSVNAYLGVAGIIKALELGADIIITGRCVDSAVVLAPLMHEFQWKINDYDLRDLRLIHKIIFSSSSFFLSSMGIYAISFFIALMASLYFSGSAKSIFIKLY